MASRQVTASRVQPSVRVRRSNMRTVIALSVLVLAGCTNAAQSPVVPPSSGGPAVGSLARQQPAAYSNGIYVAEFNNNAVFAYANQNRRNAPPVCGEKRKKKKTGEEQVHVRELAVFVVSY